MTLKISGRRTRRADAGVTLIELMVVVSLMVILSAAVTRAFIAGIDTERVYARREQARDSRATIERHLTEVVRGAMLSGSATDTTTFFVGEFGNAGPATGTGAASASPSMSSSGGSGSNTSASGVDLGCDRLTFTTTAPGISLARQASQDDFETQQKSLGPAGGVTEISLSMTAVGNAGDKSGLFERRQTPSDGDATQGGTESVLGADVQNIGFQFWDGTQWVSTWDSSTGQDANRLPAAVQISYTMNNDPSNTVHTLLIAVPTSDVTTQNPIVATATTTTTGAGQ